MLVDSIRQDVINKKTDRIPLLVIAAQKGNGKACNLLGWMFDNGIGTTKKEPAKALKWFESCSRQNMIASYNAGVMYIEGRGVDKDTQKGMAYLKRAWVVGGVNFHPQMPQIPIRLAYFYRKQQQAGTDAWDWAERASDVNARHGKYLVARMLMEKSAPTTDDVKAQRFLNAAVEAYSAPAASLLAWGYGTGRFGDKDYVLAQQYEYIAGKIDPQLAPVAAVKWAGRVKEDGKQKAEALANNWMSIHKPPKPIDFVSTLNGLEDQFKR
jgi:TPR repeat protein